MRREKFKADELREIHSRMGYHCSFCNKDSYTEKHHIVYYSISKDNNPKNILLLCPSCHELMHYGSGIFNVETQLIIKSDKEKAHESLKRFYELIASGNIEGSFIYYLNRNLQAQLTKLGWYYELNKCLFAFKDYAFSKIEYQYILYLLKAEASLWQGQFLMADQYVSKIKHPELFEGDIKSKYYDLSGRIINYIVSKKDLSDKYVFQDALDRFNRAIEYSTSEQSILRINSNIISIHTQRSKNEEGLSLSLKSIEQARLIHDNYSLASNLDRIGTLLNNTHEYERAYTELKESFLLTKMSNHKRGYAYRMRNLANTLIGLKEYKEAWIALKISEKISGMFIDINDHLLWSAEENLKESIRKSKYNLTELQQDINRNWFREIDRLDL